MMPDATKPPKLPKQSKRAKLTKTSKGKVPKTKHLGLLHHGITMQGPKKRVY